jgi:hypothetical protein
MGASAGRLRPRGYAATIRATFRFPFPGVAMPHNKTVGGVGHDTAITDHSRERNKVKRSSLASRCVGGQTASDSSPERSLRLPALGVPW